MLYNLYQIIKSICAARAPLQMSTTSEARSAQITKAGSAVVLTTHSMEEAEALCSRIGISECRDKEIVNLLWLESCPWIRTICAIQTSKMFYVNMH